MTFREDVFSKIVTYITIAVLLSAMLTEGVFLSKERKGRQSAETQLSVTKASVISLQEQTRQLTVQNTELQQYKDLWENNVLLEETDSLRSVRTDLSKRPELIPQKAVNDCRKAIAAQKEETLELAEDTESSDLTVPEESELYDEAVLAFSFPDASANDWLIPLNGGSNNTQPQAQLYYAIASDITRRYVIRLLYEIPTDPETGLAQRNEDGKLIWNCVAYEAGLGWTHMAADKKK